MQHWRNGHKQLLVSLMKVFETGHNCWRKKQQGFSLVGGTTPSVDETLKSSSAPVHLTHCLFSILTLENLLQPAGIEIEVGDETDDTQVVTGGGGRAGELGNGRAVGRGEWKHPIH